MGPDPEKTVTVNVKMKSLILVAVIIIMTVTGGVLALKSWNRPAPVVQPIRFNHKAHLKEEVTCTDCHVSAEDKVMATVSPLKSCMECHAETLGKDPEEPKVQEYDEKGKEIPWVRVNRLPGHVYFSHRAHIKLGKMDCKECHGDMTQQEKPAPFPTVKLNMEQCIACHKEKRARNDCLTCHK